MPANVSPAAVTIEEQPHLTTAVIRATCPPDQLSHTIDRVYGALMPALSTTQVEGAPFIRFFQMDDTIVDLEGGIAVRGPVPTSGQIQAGELPAGPAAVIMHTGHYDRLSDTYDALHTWLASSHYEKSAPSWEVYITDPREEPDISRWQTRIVVPVRLKASE